MLSKLGGFQILEVIGRGGMGIVYRGVDPIIGRPVAVKVIRLVGYHDSEEQQWLRDRLFREARAAGSLCHPGIVTIYQVGEERDVAYIAMEFVDGSSLENILARAGIVDKIWFCRVLSEAAAALDYAHKRGLVHRDIKPANVMISASGATKITDFGIAKTMLGQTATKTGMVLGTPFYMSPEQIRGNTLDGRSDQFALAVMAYETFTGRKPFQAEQLTSICYQIIHEDPFSPEYRNTDLGPELTAVLKKGLAKVPEERYSTCTEFAEALKAAAHRAVAGGVQQSERPEIRASMLSGNPELERVMPPRLCPRLTVAHLAWVFAVASIAVAGILLVRLISSSAAVHSPADLGQASALSPISSQPAERNHTQAAAFKVSAKALAAAPMPNRTSPAIPFPGPLETVVKTRQPHSAVHSEDRSQTSPYMPLQDEKAKTVPPGTQVKQGVVVWTGHVSAGGLLTIAGGTASIGSLSGSLPARPMTVEAYPAEIFGLGLTVFTADSRYVSPMSVPTPRGIASFVFDPRHATDIMVFEQPSEANRWDRLVIGVRTSKLSACVLHWRSE